MSFKALWITEKPDGKIERSIIQREIDDLPPGEVLIRVCYSSLNLKMHVPSGNKGIPKKFRTPASTRRYVERAETPLAADDEVHVTVRPCMNNFVDSGRNSCSRSWIVPRPRTSVCVNDDSRQQLLLLCVV